jgi:thiamine-monophosphate kinase
MVVLKNGRGRAENLMREEDVVAAIRATFARYGVAGEEDDDDCSRIDQLLASHVTTDVVVEGVDFDRALYPLRYAGQRALAQNVSDLFANDCEPVGFLQALCVPPHMGLPDVVAFCDGMARLAGALGLPLLGGDLSRTDGPLTCAITALGRAPGLALSRRGARVSQGVWLTGPVGGSAAGLRVLQRDRPGDVEDSFWRWRQSLPLMEQVAVRAHLEPSVVHHLERLSDYAVAAIDISDGLARDASRLAKSSGVAIDLDTLAAGIDRAAGATLHDALGGGEDWVLLFAVPEGLTPEGCCRVGTVVDGPAGAVWHDGVRVDERGHDHFAGRSHS